MARLRELARKFEGDPRTQYAWHKWAMRFWLFNAVAVILMFIFLPDAWQKISVLYLVLVSLYANWATDFGAMSAAEAAAEEPVSAHKINATDT